MGNKEPVKSSVVGCGGSKILSCFFEKSVLCSFRKDEKIRGLMERCSECREYKRVMAEIEADDEEVMDEIDEIRRTGVWK